MRIQHNIAALNSYRQLSSNNNNVAKNLEKLSSGYRINRAGDDAAGLAISEKMRAQIKGLETAQKNANDGISLIQTAEGNLQEVHSMLNRMVELATQAANGTYSDENRAELQKEIVALNDEIDRISQSANFNGIKLLDGSLAKSPGVAFDSVTQVAATKSGGIGTLGGTANDGKLTAGSREVKYSASIYVGDFTNNQSAKDLTFNYTDNEGNTTSIDLEIGASTSVSAEDIANALMGETVSGITVTDNGTALATGGGKFDELFDVTLDGNILTITAKYSDGAKVGSKTIDSSQIGGVSVDTSDLDSGDLDDATKHIMEDLGDADSLNTVSFGAMGDVTAFKAENKGTYEIASTTLQISGDAESLHNTGLKVGDKTYVFRTDGKELKGVPENAIVVDLNSIDDNSTTKIAQRMAEAITRTQGQNGGFAASSDSDALAAGTPGATLVIYENANRANDILENNKTATKASSIAKLESFVTEPARFASTLTISGENIDGDITVEAGGKKYYLTSDEDATVPRGMTLVKYNEGASGEEIVQKLKEAMENDDLTVSVAGDRLTYTGTDEIGATGKGLIMQVGETNESYQKIAVSVKKMDAASLGVGDINISTQVGAAAAIDSVNAAITKVSSARGDLGALQNRLEHTINNLGVTTENITAAESRIRDTDMAKEMMDFTKNNILVQAAQAMLAQANMVPQSVLQLLQ